MPTSTREYIPPGDDRVVQVDEEIFYRMIKFFCIKTESRT